MSIQDKILARAKELMADGTVTSVLGWKKGESYTDPSPAFFTSVEELERDFIFNHFCGQNLSRLLNGRKAEDGKVLMLCKPCDAFSLNQMLGQHRLERDSVYVLGIPSPTILDADKLRAAGIKGIRGSRFARGGEVVLDTIYGEKRIAGKDAVLEKCLSCKTHKFPVSDEILVKPKGEDHDEPENPYRFAGVEELEAMTPDERFAFWQSQLKRCIRCNACRNACPVCACVKCVFDNPGSEVAGKSNIDAFDDKLFHVIRAFHVAGRCTDCGECSRACPEGIPLHLLNRKFIKDINRIYGPFQAGASDDGVSPLTEYTTEDMEPGEAILKGSGS